MFCSRCGRELPDNASVCYNCGVNTQVSITESKPQVVLLQPHIETRRVSALCIISFVISMLTLIAWPMGVILSAIGFTFLLPSGLILSLIGLIISPIGFIFALIGVIAASAKRKRCLGLGIAALVIEIIILIIMIATGQLFSAI